MLTHLSRVHLGVMFLLLLSSFSGFSQENTLALIAEEVKMNVKTKGDVSHYSFVPATDFDSFKSSQRVDRMNTITGDNAVVVFKKNKVWIKVNSTKTSGENLDKLLKLIIRLHGYNSYSLIE